jgi:hypothetical protein
MYNNMMHLFSLRATAKPETPLIREFCDIGRYAGIAGEGFVTRDLFPMNVSTYIMKQIVKATNRNGQSPKCRATKCRKNIEGPFLTYLQLTILDPRGEVVPQG